VSISTKLGILFSVVLVASLSVASAQGKPQRVRAKIVALHGDVLQVERGSRTVSIELKPDTNISAVKNVSLSDVKAGTYIGAPAVQGTGGKLTASALLVFPEAARGTQEGHFPYDFGATSTMTNANVDAVVEATNGRELSVSYKGGRQKIVVPESVPVVTFAPATRADLKAGKKVVVVAIRTPKGSFQALVLLVEKDGVVPPL